VGGSGVEEGGHTVAAKVRSLLYATTNPGKVLEVENRNFKRTFPPTNREKWSNKELVSLLRQEERVGH
jgi:hypothetical protein